MRKYDIDTLDQKIENIISKTVKCFYTDWKNYDRPKYMKMKGDQTIKNITLIVRKSGTYIFSDKEIATSESAKTIIEYFRDQEKSAKFYNIDMTKGTIKAA